MTRIRSLLATTAVAASLTSTTLATTGPSRCAAFGTVLPTRRRFHVGVPMKRQFVRGEANRNNNNDSGIVARRGIPTAKTAGSTRRHLFVDEGRANGAMDTSTVVDGSGGGGTTEEGARAERGDAVDDNLSFSFFKTLKSPQSQSKTQSQTETPSQTKRQRRERLAQITLSERLRQTRVSQDKLPYLFLLSLQFLPLLGSFDHDRRVSVLYFFGLAVATVYLGGRQEVVDPPERVSRQNALFAPVGASAAIAGLYLLLKLGVDPTALYAVGVTMFGALAIADVGVPILRNVLPGVEWETAGWAVGEIPGKWAEAMGLDLEENERGEKVLPLDGVLTLGIGVLCTLAYWAPVAMENKFLISNAIAWALAMVSLGAISLGSFQTGAILLAGLFCYDIFWVFGTDVMMTVATKVEAPVKFLYPAPPSDAPKAYPFSVLGLGDVVIPGLFVRFATKIDEALQPKNLSYFSVATAAYALGLLACFGVNEVTHAGQPALLYLDPSLVGSALACAAANDQLEEVWNFKEEEAEGEINEDDATKH